MSYSKLRSAFKDLTFYDYYTYHPVNNSFKNNDEIRFQLQSQETYTFPSDSYVYLEGTFKATKLNAATSGAFEVELISNAFPYFFDSVRYEVNGVEVDRTRAPGVTSTAKILCSSTIDETRALKVAGWGSPTTYESEAEKIFYGFIPIRMLLGFPDDFADPLIRQRQDLFLVRARSDKNVYRIKVGAENVKIALSLTTVQWLVPLLKFNLSSEKLILDCVKDNFAFPIEFRSYETHVLPQLPDNNKETWKLMTTTNVEAPAFIILIFQTDRMDNEKTDASKFDHVRLRSFKVRLNNASLPYENLNESFDRGRYFRFYQYYLRFLEELTDGTKLCEPTLTYEEFKTDNPMFIMRCLHEEFLKTGPLDMQIEMEAEANFPKNTVAYAILIHDVKYAYESLTGIVKRISN